MLMNSVRFLPNANANTATATAPTLTTRAWDGTQGTVHTAAVSTSFTMTSTALDGTATDGSSSTGTSTHTVTISPVNDDISFTLRGSGSGAFADAMTTYTAGGNTFPVVVHDITDGLLATLTRVVAFDQLVDGNVETGGDWPDLRLVYFYSGSAEY